MRFYTNVQMVGDNFLVRGYEDGRHFMTREKFNPTLFVPANKKTKYQTLNGEYVESVQPGSVRDCREFVKKYENVENFKIFGNTQYIYQYISDMYPEEELQLAISKILGKSVDYLFPDWLQMFSERWKRAERENCKIKFSLCYCFFAFGKCKNNRTYDNF